MEGAAKISILLKENCKLLRAMSRQTSCRATEANLWKYKLSRNYECLRS